MKKIVALLSVLIIIIIACNTRFKQDGLISNPGVLVAEEYVIPVGKDTTIETKHGALLKFPKGAFNTSLLNVTLEIKEAYSMEQMVLAGLTTQSNGKPLSSGGMIYINAKEKGVRIGESIQVATPADYLEEKMQLFKGEADQDGNVNWIDP